MNISRYNLYNYFLLVLCMVIFSSCAKDIIDFTGDVTGTVRSKKDNSLIEGCIVTITPSNNSTATSSAGVYSFSDLDAGSYTLAFDKSGYEPTTQTISVVSGDVKTYNMFLVPIEEGIIVEPGTLNFGDLETTMELYISKQSMSSSAVAYTVSSDAECISVSPSSGTLSGAQQSIKVVVDRSKVSAGDYSKKVTISSLYGKIEIPILFQKVETSAPKISNNGDFYEITETSFKVDGLILGTGGLQITNYGHCWSLSENPTINDNRTTLGNTKEVGAYTSTVTNGISAGKTYYVRAYATNSLGTSYSDQQTINIPKMTAPVVKTLETTSITKTAAVLNGLISDNGGGDITECGFYFGKTENPTIKKMLSSNDNTTLKLALTELTDGTKYYYKAYAKNSKGENCGEILSFTTLSESVPTVETGEVFNITTTSATINGTILDKGSSDIKECGFYFGKTENPTIKKVLNSNDNTTLKLALTELTDGTKYYYKAYAKNSKGENCGEIKSFTTKEEIMPTIQTNPATDITINSATLNGAILDEGSLEIIDRGFYFGKTSNPTTKKSILNNSTSLTYNVGGLEGGITYYYKSYVKNAKQEVCGNVVSFTTIEERAPVVKTLNADRITYNSAQLKGMIADKGTSDIKSCGFYYGTSVNPTIRIESNSNDDEIICDLSNLTAGTKYYYKAFAKNHVGESYGEIKNFTPDYEKVCYEDLFISDIPVYIKLPDDSKMHEYNFSISSKVNWDIESSSYSLSVSPTKGTAGNSSLSIKANTGAISYNAKMTIAITSGDILIGIIKISKQAPGW